MSNARGAAKIAQWLLEEGGARLGALLAGVAVLVVLWSTLPAQGLTDDDDFYAPAGMSYAGWLEATVTSPGEAFTQASVDRAFKPNREHPPFAKYVIGITHRLTTALGIFRDLDGARAGVALLAALLALLMVRLLWRPFGALPALSAPLLLFSLPRFFFHSQVATLDVPVASMVMATTAMFFWGERSRAFAWATGIVFGLALLTKLNAPFAALPCLIFALLSRWRGFAIARDARGAPHVVVPPVPRALWAMALVGPVVFFVGWPWLWFDPFMRLGAYFGFHLKHYPILLFYQGEIFHEPFAPWHMPFVMAAGTIPLPVLLLGAMGLAFGIRAIVRIARNATVDGESAHRDEGDQLLALLTLQAVFAIGIVAFSPVPKYGGEKLFMPLFPLFAALAAAGVREVLRALIDVMPTLAAAASYGALPAGRDDASHTRRWVAVAALSTTIGLAALPGYIATSRFFGGYALSYYSEALGGLRGAVARGYERTYYDIADKTLARWLDDNAADERVHFAPNHKEYVRTYRWLKRDGVIRQTFRLEKDRRRASVVVLTHERRWHTYPGLLEGVRGMEIVYEKSIDGVPLYTVYRQH